MSRITKTKKNHLREPQEIESQLEEIYQDSDGTIPDMHHIERRKSKTGMMIVFSVLFFLAAATGAAWLGFFIFNPSQKFSEDLVSVSITDPAQIISGVESDFVITIRNDNKLALATSDIELKLPENFIITKSDQKATTQKNDSWLIGAIDGGASKTIHFTGAFAAPKDTRDSMRALLSYRPENFNAEFQKTISHDVTVAADSFSLTLTRKPLGNKDQFIATYKNVTATMLAGVRVIISLGPNFKVEKTNPAGAQNISGALAFTLDVPANAQGTVTISGAYTGPETPINARIERTFGDTPEVLVRAASSGTDVVSNSLVPVIQPAQLTRTDDAPAMPVAPDDTVALTGTFTNTTDKPMRLTQLVLTGDTPAIKNKGIFDFTNLQTSGNPDAIGKQIADDRRLATITWSADQIPGGAELASGKSITVTVHIKRKSGSALSLASEKMVANFLFSVVSEGSVAVVSDPLVIQLSP